MKRRFPLALLLLAGASLAALRASAVGPTAANAAPPPLASTATSTTPSLEDYRRFRRLSLDLVGRAPTREEIAAFERPGFNVEGWIDKQLGGEAYVERLNRIYMDALRLETGPAFLYDPPAQTLRREQILGPDKKPIYVYYRANQRRKREETDGEMCLTQKESGLQFPVGQAARGTAIPVKKAVLDAATVVVKPWWLYKDYRKPAPTELIGKTWTPEPGFTPVKELLLEPDGKTPTTEIRICREEAQVAESGHIYLTGRAPLAKGAPIPFGRLRPPPADDGYAKQHGGEAVACTSQLAVVSTMDCGCGPGLERCMPAANAGNDPLAFMLPNHVPLGMERPMGVFNQTVSSWSKFWWAREAEHVLDHVFANDRDFRELLTARYTFINGPLAQFYRSSGPGSCCGREKPFGMSEESEPLFDPRAVPASIDFRDTTHWTSIADRGPHAAGLLTTPAFLTKYASRRARGAAIYSAFLCKSFSAPSQELKPSTEPNLMIRDGCSTCHATLEPLAAYFARVEETSWTFLPASKFPIDNAACKANPKTGKLPGFCDFFYDVAFSDPKAGKLRGAYASAEHTNEGPVGAGKAIAALPEVADCAVERVASAFLGRPLAEDDAELKSELREVFVRGGYRMKPLVKALVRSPSYLGANNESSALFRQERGVK
jgi:hypothetical protein